MGWDAPLLPVPGDGGPQEPCWWWALLQAVPYTRASCRVSPVGTGTGVSWVPVAAVAGRTDARQAALCSERVGFWVFLGNVREGIRLFLEVLSQLDPFGR